MSPSGHTHPLLTLSASNYNTKTTIELPSESDGEILLNAFRTLAIGLGFSSACWDDVLLTHVVDRRLATALPRPKDADDT